MKKILLVCVFLHVWATTGIAAKKGYFHWKSNSDNYTLICTFGSANNESIYGCTVVAAATASDVLRAGKDVSHLSLTIRSGTAGVNITGATTVAGQINEASIEVALFAEEDVAELFRNNTATMATPPMYKAIVDSNSNINFAQMNRAAADSLFLAQYGNYTIPIGQTRYIVFKITPLADGLDFINTYGLSLVARFGYR